MIYLHPWEFDPDQPVLPMTMLSRFRHRVNLARTGEKLDWLMTQFNFQEARQCLQSLQPEQLPIHIYGQPATQPPATIPQPPAKKQAA
jgi:hypothetical protein